MKRRLLSVALALCLMVGVCIIPAWAEDEGISQIYLTPNGSYDYDYTDRTSVTTTLTATLAATQINVTVPTSLPFTLDVSKTVTSSTPSAQVTSGSTFTVENQSGVPVYLSISSCSVSDSINLTKTLTDLDSGKNLFFTVYCAENVPDFTQDQSNTIPGYISANSKNFPVSTSSSSIPSSSSGGTTFYLAARAGHGLGLAVGEKFTITVTFVVSTKYIC